MTQFLRYYQVEILLWFQLLSCHVVTDVSTPPQFLHLEDVRRISRGGNCRSSIVLSDLGFVDHAPFSIYNRC